jgi:hypothetical protein
VQNLKEIMNVENFVKLPLILLLAHLVIAKIDLYSRFFQCVIYLLFISIGGAANVFVGQSLDTVKVKMQTFPS